MRRFLRRSLPLVKVSNDRRLFDRHIFICGLHRSGTTLLESLLSARYDAARLRAPVPENEGQHLQDVYPIARAFGGPGAFAFAPEMHPEPPGPDEANRFRARLTRCWRSWTDGESSTLIEKSPPNLTKIGWLRAVFPGARFIVITRDPRVVAAATQKWSKTPISELMRHWNVAYAAAAAMLRDEDCTILRYEDLCAFPEMVLGRVARETGLTPRPTPLLGDARFETLRNTNERYLSRLASRKWGSGSWERFGYKLAS